MESMKAPKPMRWMVVVSAVFLAASLIVSGVNAYVAFASPNQSQSPNVPLLVGFEGQLSDSQGSPVSGSKTLTFKLYDEATGTNPALWTEQQTVTVANGLYTVQLGSVTALQASYFQGQRWLGIQVQGDSSELSPRIPVSSVPFALNAKLSENSISAEGLQGNPVATTTPTVGQSLTWGGSSWQPVTVKTGAPGITLENSAAETTILTRVIPANSLSTNGYLQFEVWALVTNPSAAPDELLTFNIKFGTKTMTHSVYTKRLGTSANQQLIRLTGILANSGATNAQFITMEFMDTGLDNTAGVYDATSPDLVWDSASINTTTDQTFTITFQMQSAISGFTTNILGASLSGPLK